MMAQPLTARPTKPVRRPAHRLAVAALLAGLTITVAGFGTQQPAGALARYDLDRGKGLQTKLARGLDEISGLAVMGDRVFGHGDERAVVYGIDLATGATTVAFAPGERGLRGDFEGVALADGRMYLVTSGGVLIAFRTGRDGEGIPYETHRGLSERNCEVEGLEHDAATRSLLLACKTTGGRALRDRLVVFAYSLERLAPEAAPRYAIPLADIARRGGGNDLDPSGIAIHPVSHTLFVVAARQKLIVEFGRDGRVLGTRALPGRDHAQPEGIAFLEDGTMLIADEAAGGRATITRYPFGPSP